MTQKNRELSQFGSFLEVNNTNQNIGIATTGTPYIGIGTINPQYKLHLVGDTNVEGTIYLNGTPIVDASLQPWELDGSDIYRESGSVGIGTSVYPSTLSVLGDATFSDEVTASRFISTVTTGTSPFTVTSQTEVTNLNASFLRGKTPPSGSIVGTTDIQTLTNKTLNLSSNTLTGTTSQFNTALSDDDFVTLAGTQTLSNKTLITPIISGIRPSAGQLQNIPSGSGTLVSSNSVGVITTGMIADGTITSIDISSSAGITNGQLVNSTISGISLGNNLNNLTAGSYITYDSGSTYNGSTSRTIGVAGTTLNTANTLVARDVSGDFSAGSIAALSFNATSDDAYRINGTTVIDSNRNVNNIGVLTATSFNATSDDAYRINGTTIIDSNRNVNNIGVLTATSISDNAGDVRKVPQNSKTSSYTLVASDSGKHINITSGGIIVPADIFSPGDAITIFNNSSSNQTITQDTNVTLRLAGSSLTGNRTLSQYGICTILNVTGGSTPTFVISGAGLS
jgi:hypothetical protein